MVGALVTNCTLKKKSIFRYFIYILFIDIIKIDKMQQPISENMFRFVTGERAEQTRMHDAFRSPDILEVRLCLSPIPALLH